MRFSHFLITLVSGCLAHGVLASESELARAYTATKAEATRLAGGPLDMPKRAILLHAIYRDSIGNHRFPLVALHGALWGYGFFKRNGPIGDAISKRYFYDRKEERRRKEMLRHFSNTLAETNRAVFIDTYTNYYFTKAHGTEPSADTYVPAPLLEALNRVHAAANLTSAALDEREKREIFKTALAVEQESTVGPTIAKAVADFQCPVMKFLALRPVVHFAYFPPGKRFFFHDFSDKTERIRRAIAAYDIAASVGWSEVEAAMHDYPDFR